jgi:hypothetical protein
LSFERGGKEVVLVARSVWSRPSDGGWVSGIAFTTNGTDAVVAEALGTDAQEVADVPNATDNSVKSRDMVTLTALIAVGGYLLCTVL